MIVVKIMGGLGNQMFQYAFGRAISHQLNRRLVLDLSMMPTGSAPYLRHFELDRLPISPSASVVRRFDRRGSVYLRNVNGLLETARSTKALRRALRRFRLDEPDGECPIKLSEIPPLIAVCTGYWQSPSYFQHVTDKVRQELTPRLESGGLVNHLLSQYAGRETVAVHIRRGDYTANPNVNAVHGTQTPAYYAKAVMTIAETLEESVVALVLSDDPIWAKENIRLGVETVHVEAGRRLSTIDSLTLMSRCRHHVIANSSFSWWGAWLAESPSQLVIHPSRWFARKDVNPALRFPRHWQSESEV